MLIQGDHIIESGPASECVDSTCCQDNRPEPRHGVAGLIDGHVHLTDAAGGLQPHQTLVALHSATESLRAGFDSQVVMGTHGGGYADVELKKAIETRSRPWTALITAGPVIEITSPASVVYAMDSPPFEPALIANGAEGMRGAVRELAHYGADHVKIMSTGLFASRQMGKW